MTWKRFTYILLPSLLLSGCSERPPTPTKSKTVPNPSVQSSPTVTVKPVDKTTLYYNYLSDLLSPDPVIAKKSQEQLETEGSEIIPFLIANLDRKEPKVRKLVRELLSKRSDTESQSSAMLNAFQDVRLSQDSKAIIAQHFVRFQKKEKAVSLLAQACGNSSNTRKIAHATLRSIGHEAQSATAILIEVLDKDNRSDFGQTLETLKQVGAFETKLWLDYVGNALTRLRRNEIHKYRMIETLNSAGTKANPIFLSLLANRNSYASNYAAQSLKAQGAEAIPLLTKYCKKRQFRNCDRALAILRPLLSNKPQFFPFLIKHYKTNKSANQASLKLIANSGDKAIPILLDLAKSEGDTYAVSLLIEIGKPGAQALADNFKSLGESLKDIVITGIGRRKSIGHTIFLPLLISALRTEDSLRVKKALRAIKAHGSQAGEAIEELSKLYQKTPRSRSVDPTPVLIAIGNQSIPVFLAGLKSTETTQRQRSIRALIQLKLMTPNTMKAVRECLEDNDAFVRRKAMDYLSSFGPDSNPFIPYLNKILAGSQSSKWSSALLALERIGTKESCLALLASLQSKQSSVRQEAFRRLQSQKQFATIIEKRFFKIAQEKNSPTKVKRKVMDWLAASSQDRKSALKLFIKFSKSNSTKLGFRLKAISLFKCFPKESKTLSPLLVKLAKSKQKDIRIEAYLALIVVGENHASVQKIFRNAIKDNDPVIQQIGRDGLATIQKR